MTSHASDLGFTQEDYGTAIRVLQAAAGSDKDMLLSSVLDDLRASTLSLALAFHEAGSPQRCDVCGRLPLGKNGNTVNNTQIVPTQRRFKTNTSRPQVLNFDPSLTTLAMTPEMVGAAHAAFADSVRSEANMKIVFKKFADANRGKLTQVNFRHMLKSAIGATATNPIVDVLWIEAQQYRVQGGEGDLCIKSVINWGNGTGALPEKTCPSKTTKGMLDTDDIDRMRVKVNVKLKNTYTKLAKLHKKLSHHTGGVVERGEFTKLIKSVAGKKNSTHMGIMNSLWGSVQTMRKEMKLDDVDMRVLAAWAKIALPAEAIAVFEKEDEARRAAREKERLEVAKLRVIKGDTPDTATAVGRPNPPKKHMAEAKAAAKPAAAKPAAAKPAAAKPVAAAAAKPKTRLVFSSSDEDDSDDDLFG
jgi:hypothetical protein